MAKKKSDNKVGLIAIFVVLVMLVLAIVGVCIAWVSGGLTETGYKLGDLHDLYTAGEGEVASVFKGMEAFAILTVILAAATTVLAGISKVLGWKLFRFILVVVAIVCVVCAVLAIVLTYSFCDKVVNLYSPAAGMWLTAIGGALAGIGGIFAAVKS